MFVKINPRKITPDLRQKISDHAGQDISQYPSVVINTGRVPVELSFALIDASKVSDSGVSKVSDSGGVVLTEESAIPTRWSKPAAVEVKPKEEPLVLNEGGQRLRYHVKINGLLNSENNILAIKDWFARHPEATFDAATIDRVVFREIEEELLWEPGNRNHEFWVQRFNPPLPSIEPPKPPKPKQWGKLPNGEKRLPIPSTAADLAKASLVQVEDYRDRLRQA